MNIKSKAKVEMPFSGIVVEAVEVELQYGALTRPEAMKLTPKASVMEAMRIADTTNERLGELRRKLETPTTFDMTELIAALRRMILMVRSPNYPWPPRELRRVRHALTPAADVALVQIGSTSFELFALATVIAAEEHPGDFGECNSSVAYDKRMLELSLRRSELNQQIEEAWQPEDIVTSEPDKDGRVKVTFLWNGSDTGVSVYPREGAGARLVRWILENDSARR